MRGEDLKHSPCKTASIETPPHAWGRLNGNTYASTCIRNTPTCVGKTDTRSMLALWLWKHPHMRGEDYIDSEKVCKGVETPPHAWGRRSVHITARRYNGNTPTCVGKTVGTVQVVILFWKHPHMRGEDLVKPFHRIRNIETPPHAWGRRPHVYGKFSGLGNTPTCVGKTIASASSRCPSRKHPHMRGEDR